MHDFTDFNDYRVGGWLREGMIVAVDNVVHSIRTTFTAAAAAMAVGLAGVSVATFAYSSEALSPVWTRAAFSVVEERISALNQQIDATLPAFGNDDLSGIDPQILALATATIAAVAQRNSSSKS
jgi:hypothetical protein